MRVGEELRLVVSSQDYLSKLVEYGIMKLHAAAIVKETNQSWIEEDDFQVIMPNIDIKVSKQSFYRSKSCPYDDVESSINFVCISLGRTRSH